MALIKSYENGGFPNAMFDCRLPEGNFQLCLSRMTSKSVLLTLFSDRRTGLDQNWMVVVPCTGSTRRMRTYLDMHTHICWRFEKSTLCKAPLAPQPVARSKRGRIWATFNHHLELNQPLEVTILYIYIMQFETLAQICEEIHVLPIFGSGIEAP